VALALVALGVCAARAEESVRVRIAWGGGTARIWQGSVSVEQGQLSELRPLGLEADEPGSMWIEDNRVQIRQRSSRVYDGLDLLVSGPAQSAVLHVTLAARDAPQETTTVDVPLAQVLAGSVRAELDKHGSQLLARRAPGDTLRVEWGDRALVFAPGEVFSLKVAVDPPQTRGGQGELRAVLRSARGSEVAWELAEPVALGDPAAAVPLSVPLNVREGAYDLVLSVQQRPGLRLPQVGPVPLAPARVLVERKVQLLVLEPEAPETSAARVDLAVVQEIDPINERWWERFAKPVPLSLPRLERLQWKNLQRFWKGPLGSGDVRARDHALGRMSELPPSRAPGQTSWEAFTLPVTRTGRPHVLEVEYPSDVPQRLGISVMEPNAAGALVPLQLDSGVVVTEPWLAEAGEPPTMLRHRVIFWPRTTTPLVLVTNRSATRPAVFGKVRVLAGGEHLPRAFPKAEIPPERLLAGYFAKPLFPESFGASEAYDESNQRSLEDWTTFYEGGTRLVEYLEHAGMNGLLMTVLGDGATIYPSRVIQPTSRYDKGVFFGTGQDPVQKDVLEMLLRLFDRHQLRLIPAVEFAAPLPELEEMLRRGGPAAEGLQWIGPGGIAWHEAHLPEQRLAPYYNLLHPAVQEAMFGVVRELADRYLARHESFAGLAIQLSSSGYAVLPGPEWGLDDTTVARFAQETGIRVPGGSGEDRFARREKFLLGERRQEWLAWRAATVARFYERVQAELSARRAGARLYLATADLMRGPHWSARLRPTLGRRPSLGEILWEVGLDADRFTRPDGPVLLYPDCAAPVTSPDEEALALEAAQMLDLAGRQEQWPSPGSLLFHAPEELRLESFDRRSPFRESYTSLLAEFVPAGRQRRRGFVRSLALLDASFLFDGGRLVPLALDDTDRELVAIYRRLPAVPFKLLSEGTTQPVTIRYATYGQRTYVYAANDSPVPATLLVRVDGPPGCRMMNLADGKRETQLERRADGLYWRVSLAPYDLAAVWLSAPDVALSEPQVLLSDEVQAALDSRIARLGARAAALRSPPAMPPLPNANFEQASEEASRVVGWDLVRDGQGGAVRLEPTPPETKPGKPAGQRSVRLWTDGAGVALVSKPFEAPTTGRLTLYAWLRVPEANRQPPVELVLTGRRNGRELPPRTAVLGRSLPGHSVPPIGAAWGQFYFPVHDLPLDGLDELRVAIRLAGPGEVWIDDVQLDHLDFKENELKQLSQIFSTAHMKLRTHQVGDCIRLLEGYWPRFLEDHVPLETAVAARPKTDAARPQQSEPPPESPGLLDRMKGIVPRKVW